MHPGEDVWPSETEDSHDSKPPPGHRGNGRVPHARRSEFDVATGLDGANGFEGLDMVGGSARLRIFELFDRILEAGRIKGPQSERICHTITASNAWGLRMGLLGMLGVLPLLWVSGRITRPNATFRR